MTPSHYQLAIFDQIKNSNDNLMIEAVAGSGKSTTLELAVKELADDCSVLVVAFNKDIVEALRPRIKHPFAEVCTLNSFGHRIVMSQLNRPALDKNKTEIILQEFVQQKDWYKIKGMISRIVELKRATLDSKSTEELAEEYGIELPNYKGITELCDKVYESCIQEKTLIDFRDQVYFPIKYNLTIPTYDIVLVDEVQDLDLNQAELVIRAGRRLIMVGDSRQAVYGFRGAMASAMQDLKIRTKATELPLSVCYRCPKSAIAEAKKIVPQIEACDWAPEGVFATIKLDEFRLKVAPKDMILCRTIAPLVTECFSLIREGKRAIVKGRDIGEQLVSLVEKVRKGPNISDFLLNLGNYEREQVERLDRLGKEDQVLNLRDRVETIRSISVRANTISELISQIKVIFQDIVASDSIVFMSCHKSKGLEANRVFVLAPDLMPHPAAKKDWQRIQESNLKYVSLTRVKFDMQNQGELYLVRN